MTLAGSIVQFFRRSKLAWRGLQLSRDCRVGRNVRSSAGWRAGKSGRIEAGNDLELQDGVILDAWGGSIEIGTNVFIGPHAVVYGHGGVQIGDHTLVSMHCRILSSNHTVPEFATLIRSQPDILRPTRIGRDVWLGAGVTVLAGVTVGDGCIVGAGAVVTHDLPPGAIARGVPAVVTRFRDHSPSR